MDPKNLALLSVLMCPGGWAGDLNDLLPDGHPQWQVQRCSNGNDEGQLWYQTPEGDMHIVAFDRNWNTGVVYIWVEDFALNNLLKGTKAVKIPLHRA